MMIDDRDLFKEETDQAKQKEDNLAIMNNTQTHWKLTKIKEVYRLFRNCLLGKSRDIWIKVLD